MDYRDATPWSNTAVRGIRVAHWQALTLEGIYLVSVVGSPIIGSTRVVGKSQVLYNARNRVPMDQ